jgi:hypothetical protein
VVMVYTMRRGERIGILKHFVVPVHRYGHLGSALGWGQIMARPAPRHPLSVTRVARGRWRRGGDRLMGNVSIAGGIELDHLRLEPLSGTIQVDPL